MDDDKSGWRQEWMTAVPSDLSGAEVHEDVQQLHSLLHGGDRVERSGDHVLHHHLQVLDAGTEPAQRT